MHPFTMCWLGTLIQRKGFQHVTGMGDSQPPLALNTTTALGQLPVPSGRNSALDDIDLHRNTRVPLLNPLFLLPPFLFITPSSLSFCPGHHDRFPRGSGKTLSGPGSWQRERMGKEGWRKAKESLTTSTAFSSKGRRAMKLLTGQP